MENHNPKASGSRPGRHGPWPTVDSYRLTLLASIQTAESVDLIEFFRKAYPQAIEPLRDAEDAESEPSSARSAEDSGRKEE